jgi:hypothetical protein
MSKRLMAEKKMRQRMSLSVPRMQRSVLYGALLIRGPWRRLGSRLSGAS